MTPAQTQATEKLREFNRLVESKLEGASEHDRAQMHIVIREIEVVIALIEDDPENDRCSFPRCSCKFPRRCHH